MLNAYRLPKSNDAEKAARRDAIDAAMRAATEAPLATMRACERVMREAPAIADSGALAAASDVAVAIELLKTAARGAALNVDTNLADMKDADYVSRVHARAARPRTGDRGATSGLTLAGSPSETASTRNVNFTGYG